MGTLGVKRVPNASRQRSRFLRLGSDAMVDVCEDLGLTIISQDVII
jgi:hypothetical protein